VARRTGTLAATIAMTIMNAPQATKVVASGWRRSALRKY
jgi:hypothetical protein